MTVLINLGIGNIASVRNMIHRLGHETSTLETPPLMPSQGERYVLPGVGAFDEGVRRLHTSGWFEFLQREPPDTHILGICLGMQLLAEGSDEGAMLGLGRIPAYFERFKGAERVPHMGWNTVSPVGSDPIFDPALREYRYYFSHTYRAVCQTANIAIGATNYGDVFPSAYRLANTRGVQFHPEKSHKFGMSILDRWIRLAC